MTDEAEGGRRRRFHTETFEKIDADRRKAILSVALAEFADKGFNGTSVNGLARKAGVSIGSLYSYFPSKEDLFLTVADQGHELLERALADIDVGSGFFESFGSMLRKARDYAKSNPELNLVYLDATTQGLRHLAERLSGSLEAITASLYRRAIAAAVERGELRRGIDPGAAAFCLDNLIMLFQFSFASAYYRDRLRIFLGLAEGEEPDEEALIGAILDFARRALAA
ncbi:MAG TPA: TetR/AcrR family transcriptional regulator [Spirochaetales bacterium]|nr:TetR/AcrR family transcriptional regulator [Spirochaetales bacterium]HRY53856.1 TetR/AcrR family transcriptional regulator [Spirochaetia bacterium]HRZ64708.1 TetR/AcrR family transcriptional regulator [Spirochaetia bacterium]